VAFGEHAVDIVDWYSPVARRAAGPERRSEPHTWLLRPLHPYTDETARLARQIVERVLERRKP
jgi:hypothetical protein